MKQVDWESEKCPRCKNPVRVQLVMGAKYCWNCGCRLDQVQLKDISKEEQNKFIKQCIKLLNSYKSKLDKENNIDMKAWAEKIAKQAKKWY